MKDNIPIEELPSLPTEIVDAYNQNRLAVFVGAGISRLVGCMGWDQMANNLIDAVCSLGTADQIKTSSLGCKEKITIAKKNRGAFKRKDSCILDRVPKSDYSKSETFCTG